MSYNKKDIAKELLIVLSYCDNTIIDKIPDYIVKSFSKISEFSSININLDPGLELNQQNISPTCKYLLSLLYSAYIECNSESEKLLRVWIDSDHNLVK